MPFFNPNRWECTCLSYAIKQRWKDTSVKIWKGDVPAERQHIYQSSSFKSLDPNNLIYKDVIKGVHRLAHNFLNVISIS